MNNASQPIKNLNILAGSANPRLAERIADQLGVQLTGRILERFPDGELHIEIQESVRGHDVYVVQPTCPPVDENLLELLFLADACRRAGASRLTAVTPYFGYARQDRRSRGREPVGARVVADLINTSGIGRLVAVDLHSRSVESAFAMPLEHLSAVDILTEALRPSVRDNSVIVSPDLGAVKMAERYAALLSLPVAIIHKTRISGEQVKVQRIVGDVCNKEAIIIDDMVSTGGTIEQATKALLDAGCSAAKVKVVTTHGLLVGPAATRLAKLPIERLYVTDSVPAPQGFPLPLEIFSLAALLAETIRRLHHQESLTDLVE
jgi:ribose-phosphate pyrophosphokinase